MKKLNLVVVFNQKMNQVLFCIRAKEPYKGLYNFVGGKVENGESNDDAAYRELFEETGFKIPNGSAIVDIGLNKYLENKDLYVYAWIGKIDISNMKCTSYFNG